MKKQMKKLIVYCRVSSIGQADNTSLSMQKERCNAWAVANGYEVSETHCEVFSGKNLVDREMINAVISSVMNGAADGIVVLKIDRLGRNTADILHIAEQFNSSNKILGIVELGIDSSTPCGKMILTVMAALAEMERSTILQRCNEGRAAKKAAGGRIGGIVPFGYKLVDGQCVKDDEQQEIIQKIIRLREHLTPYSSIAERFNFEKVPTSSGGKWHGMTVRNIAIREMLGDI